MDAGVLGGHRLRRRVRRRLAVAAVAAVVAVAAVGAVAAVAAVGAVAAAAMPARATVAIGARIAGAPARPSLIDRYARATGRAPAIVSWYRDWGDQVFDRRSLRVVAARHAVPMITWDPSVAGWRRGERTSILAQISRGRWDRYIRAAARSAARYGGPILLRLAPEMNGGWSPWGSPVPGNGPAAYVAMWRHVVGVFRRENARNVLWVWCPNVDDGGQLPFVRDYPGDRWVDWVALDGYNWGGRWGWQSFDAIFAGSYNTLGRLTTKPMMIGETGSGETGGNKAAWIANAFVRELPRYHRIRALVWFNGYGETGADFRYDSSPAAAAAFRRALRLPRYGGIFPGLVRPSARRPPFVPVAVPPAPQPSGPLGFVRRTADHWGPAAAAAVVVVAAATVGALRRRRRGRRPTRV